MIRKSILGMSMLLLPFSLLAGSGNTPGNDSKEPSHDTESSTKVAAPAALTLTADNDAVTVRWQTKPDQDNSLYSVQRSTDGENWLPVFSLRCNTAASAGRVHAIFDRHLEPASYQYRVRSVDMEGTIEFSEASSIEVGPSFANPAPAMAPASDNTFGAR